jgi:hypothetical protein
MMIRSLWLAFILSLVAGCASLGVDQPQGFTDKLALGQVSNTTAVKSIALVASVGKMSKKSATDFLTQADTAQQALLSAAALAEVGDTGAANNKLLIVNGILQALTVYLQQQQAAGKDAKDTTTALMLVGLLSISTQETTEIQALFAKAHSENRQINAAEMKQLQDEYAAAFSAAKSAVDALP